jgi:hypothetical protein
METLSNPWTTSCKSNSLLKNGVLSQSFFTNVRVSCVLSGRHWRSKRFHVLWKSRMSCSNFQLNHVLDGWPTYSYNLRGSSPSTRHGRREANVRIKYAIYGDHRRSANPDTLGSTSVNSLIWCQEGTLRLAWSFHWRFVLPPHHPFHRCFSNCAAQSYCARPQTCTCQAISVDASGLNLSLSPVLW